jgi:hypothetical protein
MLTLSNIVLSVASEKSPQSLTVEAHTKHHGPFPKVGAIESDIRERYKSGRAKSLHGRRGCAFSGFFRKAIRFCQGGHRPKQGRGSTTWSV